MDEKNAIMKRTKLILFFTLLITIGSCKKEKLHKIKFKIHVLNYGQYGIYSNLEIGVWPRYEDVLPNLGDNLLDYWEYEYLGLKNGDYVSFLTSARLSIYYEKWIYIDDVEVAYCKIKNDDYKYYNDYVIETRGYGDSIQYRGFTYIEK
jgi:hypothetical protein